MTDNAHLHSTHSTAQETQRIGRLLRAPQDRSADGVPEVETAAALLAIIRDRLLRYVPGGGEQYLDRYLMAVKDEAPVPARVWMHRCGVVLINDTQPPPCHVCVSTPQIPFVRLYTLGEVR